MSVRHWNIWHMCDNNTKYCTAVVLCAYECKGQLFLVEPFKGVILVRYWCYRYALSKATQIIPNEQSYSDTANSRVCQGYLCL